MAKRWQLIAHDQQLVADLQQSAKVPAVVAQLLLARGIGHSSLVSGFLESRLSGLRDPHLLPGCSAAAERLFEAIQAGRKIVVYGDYDADGMTAAALLVRCLRMLGAEADVYVPNRLEDGYGLSCDALRSIALADAGTVVTVDCGITSVVEAREARALGLELIVTDHHQFGPTLPEADVLVHPALPGSDYPFTGLAGAGVAFKLAWALCQQVCGAKRVGERMKQFLLQSVGLAALGTVADVVPLVDENRILVHHGLHSLRANPTPGLAELLRITSLDQKPHLASEDIGFSLAPRLNAAGRLGQAELAVELLTTDSHDRARQLAEFLQELNDRRGSLERSVYLAANKQANGDFDPQADPALVLSAHDWHAGVIGIVAGRLAEKFHRPVVMVALDPLGVKPGIGSARTIPSLALHEALAACREHLLSHGGHAAAAGLTIESAKVSAFRDDFCEYVAGEVCEEDLTALLTIDAEAPLAMLTHEAVQQIERLAPFGAGNHRPVFCTTDVRLAAPAKRMGGGGRHLSLTLEQHGVRMRAVAFGKGDWADEMNQLTEPISVAFQPVINHFRGMRRVELQLSDWICGRPALVD